MHKTFFFMVLTCLLSAPALGNSSTYYELGSYRFYPEEKLITRYGLSGTCERNGLCRSFSVNEPLKHINYDSTVLIITGRDFLFKEDLQDVDLSSLQLLYPETPVLHHSYIYEYPVYADRHTVFYSVQALKEKNTTKRFTIPAMSSRHRYLLENSSKEQFVIPRTYGQDTPFPTSTSHLQLDAATLDYLDSHYYADKNGLYWLGKYKQGKQTETGLMLENNLGKTTSPQSYQNIITYGQSVYFKNWFSPIKLPYQAGDIAEHLGLYVRLKNDELYTGEKKVILPAGLTDYRLLSSSALMFERNGALYFKGPEEIRDDKKSGLLVHAKTGFYLLNAYHPAQNLHYDQVFIYDPLKQAYEPLNVENFREVDNQYYVYKNKLYGYTAPSFSDEPRFNFNNIQRLSYSNYYSDGKQVFYHNPQDIKYTPERYNWQYKPISTDRIIEGVDLASLQVINENMLIDDARIYQPDRLPIPRDRLGIKIMVINDDSPMKKQIKPSLTKKRGR